MSDIFKRVSLPGNRWNWQRTSEVEVFDDGVVRIQQGGNPVDVILLTPVQVRRIAQLSEQARSR